MVSTWMGDFQGKQEMLQVVGLVNQWVVLQCSETIPQHGANGQPRFNSYEGKKTF